VESGGSLGDLSNIVIHVSESSGSESNAFSVFSGLNSINSDNPVFTGKSFFESSELESLVLKKKI